jgi:hypothetical protein
VIEEVRLLRKDLITMLAAIGLLTRMRNARMDDKLALLGEHLVAAVACILREMGILVVRDAALLCNRDLLVAARHSAAPRLCDDLAGEVVTSGSGHGEVAL